MPKHNRTFICEECIFVFQTHSKLNKNNPYCPNCGENADVVKYIGRPSQNGKYKRIAWTDVETELANNCIDGKIDPHVLAYKTGRTLESVHLKLWRMRHATKQINDT